MDENGWRTDGWMELSIKMLHDSSKFLYSVLFKHKKRTDNSMMPGNHTHRFTKNGSVRVIDNGSTRKE